MKRLPPPGALTTRILPSLLSASRFARERPSPIPLLFVVVRPLTVPSSQYAGSQIVHTPTRCVVPHARMEGAEHHEYPAEGEIGVAADEVDQGERDGLGGQGDDRIRGHVDPE